MGSARCRALALGVSAAITALGCSLSQGSGEDPGTAEVESAIEFSQGPYEERPLDLVTVRGRVRHESSDAIPCVTIRVTVNSQRFFDGPEIDRVTSDRNGEFEFRHPAPYEVHGRREIKRVWVHIEMVEWQRMRTSVHPELQRGNRYITDVKNFEEVFEITVYDEPGYAILRCVDGSEGEPITSTITLECIDNESGEVLWTQHGEPDALGWWPLGMFSPDHEVAPSVAASQSHVRVSAAGYEPLRIEWADLVTRMTLTLCDTR